jgi:dipeptidyl aminopeptidase/acylaminoacyl peptidase
MSASRLTVATLLVAAAAGSTSVGATPRQNPPLLTFVANDSLGLCATDLEGHTFRISDPRSSGALASWSPDGSLLSYVSGKNLLFVDAEGSVHRTQSWQTGNSGVSSLVWSPDARRFAGVTYWGVYSWLWVMNTDGTSSHTIVQESGYENLPRPTWAPDGSLILFSTSSTTYVVDPNGTEPQKILDDATAPVWLPDGQRLAYVALDQNGRSVGLGVARADGGDPHTLTQGEISDPAWSPDGSTIAFTRGAGASSQVSLIGLDGANERTIASGTSPTWAPDSSWIAFARFDQATSRLQAFVVRPDGTDQRLVETGLPGANTSTFFWRPSAPFPQHRRRCVLTGTAGADVIKGTNRGDVIIGDAGRDRLYGRGGDDILIGGTGHDWLYGGQGDDFIDAYDGIRDYLFGGLGSDRGSYDLYKDRRNSIEHYAGPG